MKFSSATTNLITIFGAVGAAPDPRMRGLAKRREEETSSTDFLADADAAENETAESMPRDDTGPGVSANSVDVGLLKYDSQAERELIVRTGSCVMKDFHCEKTDIPEASWREWNMFNKWDFNKEDPKKLSPEALQEYLVLKKKMTLIQEWVGCQYIFDGKCSHCPQNHEQSPVSEFDWNLIESCCVPKTGNRICSDDSDCCYQELGYACIQLCGDPHPICRDIDDGK